MTFSCPRFRAFTLIELLITLTIFGVVSVVSVTLLVNGLRSAKKIQAQVLLYSEAQTLMDQIARDVERGTIDYESIFARNVLGESDWESSHYGWYAQSFYNPGIDGLTQGPYDELSGELYGTPCPSGSGAYPEDCPGDTPVFSAQDKDTGTHPFTGIETLGGLSFTDDPTFMNAFCRGTDGTGSEACASPDLGLSDELILVNAAGDFRVVYALKLLDGSDSEYGLARLTWIGTDADNDGVEDSWTCSGCSEGDVADLSDFHFLSPSSVRVDSFKILISPTEDPYRAYGELESQLQPQILILMTLSLSSEYSAGLLGEVPSITLQRTISTGVYSKVVSYE